MRAAHRRTRPPGTVQAAAARRGKRRSPGWVEAVPAAAAEQPQLQCRGFPLKLSTSGGRAPTWRPRGESGSGASVARRLEVSQAGELAELGKAPGGSAFDEVVVQVEGVQGGHGAIGQGTCRRLLWDRSRSSKLPRKWAEAPGRDAAQLATEDEVLGWQGPQAACAQLRQPVAVQVQGAQALQVTKARTVRVMALAGQRPSPPARSCSAEIRRPQRAWMKLSASRSSRAPVRWAARTAGLGGHTGCWPTPTGSGRCRAVGRRLPHWPAAAAGAAGPWRAPCRKGHSPGTGGVGTAAHLPRAGILGGGAASRARPGGGVRVKGPRGPQS